MLSYKLQILAAWEKRGQSDAAILLVEDDRVDAMTVRRALRDVEINNPLKVASDAVGVLASLLDEAQQLPCLILLDLCVPRTDGLEFLETAKRDERLKRIFVVVLPTSRQATDRIKSFVLGAAGDMLKPMCYRKFLELIRTIDSYWTFSQLPPEFG